MIRAGTVALLIVLGLAALVLLPRTLRAIGGWFARVKFSRCAICGELATTRYVESYLLKGMHARVSRYVDICEPCRVEHWRGAVEGDA